MINDLQNSFDGINSLLDGIGPIRRALVSKVTRSCELTMSLAEPLVSQGMTSIGHHSMELFCTYSDNATRIKPVTDPLLGKERVHRLIVFLIYASRIELTSII